MRMPIELSPVRTSARARVGRPTSYEGLSVQGCNVFEWAGCAAAIAGCAALSGPALVACVAAAAPGCVKCL